MDEFQPGVGGDQKIPRPADFRLGTQPFWVDSQFPSLLTDIRDQLSGKLEAPTELQTKIPNAAIVVPLLEVEGAVHVLLTRRSQNVSDHKGEIAFPGGKVEGNETLQEAALRETFEEVGIAPQNLELVGAFDPRPTFGSHFVLTPFVGLVTGSVELVADDFEVARIFTVPLSVLARGDVYHEETWTHRGVTDHPVHFFEVANETTWGAAGRILFELLDLLAP